MLARRISTWKDDECGGITVLALFLAVTMMIVAGLGLDVMNAMRAKTQLQVAADAAAHAALSTREFKTEAEAKDIAVAIAQASMPPGNYGNAITAADIQFGYWDAANEVFQIAPGADDAVLVTTQQASSRSNALTTFFLRFIGMEGFDVRTQSVYETYYPTCLREGFVADARVDVQSNNTYLNGFCIHSNAHVEVNNNNVFQTGTIVSMPDERTLVMPTGGFNSNPGLERALRSGAYRIKILQRIDDIAAFFRDRSSSYWRDDYLDWPVKNNALSASTNLDASVWMPGEIHEFMCNGAGGGGGGGGNGNGGGGNGNGNGKGGGGGGGGGNYSTLRIPANTVLTNGVIYTDCLISIGANVELRDVLIVSLNDSVTAVSGASGVVLGLDDGCSPGGGVQIITKGGVHFPAQLNIFGGQIIAQKKIDFEANANGIEGVSMVSGDEIDSTSNMNMGFCGGAGLENNFEAEYFRMAR
ncbi:hypothetical protein GQ651_14605 [Alphaproteobacteria bacterium GH1-50]|uniref:Uncharacterized protein n=2 Tax=Kangsaoukella pontilimi TaxID=2691042 RepID=A0A7C9MHM2_9RHOB|nr:hypothetical protein [Kangsaoukella pontilimi]